MGDLGIFILWLLFSVPYTYDFLFSVNFEAAFWQIAEHQDYRNVVSL